MSVATVMNKPLPKVSTLACLAFLAMQHLGAQGLGPTTPAKEYVRIGGRVIATENAGTPLLVVIGVSATPSANGATISWSTNIPATSQVDYGLSSSYGSSTTLDSTLVTSHSQPLSGLTANTTYHYRARSTVSGQTINSSDGTFTTAPDTTPPVISNVSAGSITSTGATITWTTNENADSQVNYGPTISYGFSTTLNTTLVTSHSQGLSGLTGGTLYHYRVKSKDAASNLATSGDFTFTTPVAALSITGNVKVNGANAPGVHMLVNGVYTGFATNSSGNYTVTGLVAGTNYTITPSLTGLFIFTPSTRSYTPLNATVPSGADFAGVPGDPTTNVSPSSGVGTGEQFSFGTPAPTSYLDADPTEMLWSTSSTTTANQCYVFSSPGSSYIKLAQDNGTAWVAPVAQAFGMVQHLSHGINYNSQCMLDHETSYFNYTQPTYAWYAQIYFFRAYAGTKGMWVRVKNGPWLPVGNYTVSYGSMTEPSVTITSPAAGAVVTGTITVTGTATSSGSTINNVKVYWDGTRPNQTNATLNGSNWSYSLATSGSAGSPHTIQVVATDNGGLKTVVTRSVTHQ